MNKKKKVTKKKNIKTKYMIILNQFNRTNTNTNLMFPCIYSIYTLSIAYTHSIDTLLKPLYYNTLHRTLRVIT